MWAHVPGITIATAGVTLCTLLPFLPGTYDPLALPLSMMARVAGFVGLLFAPIGVFWMAAGFWPRLAGMHHACAVAAMIVSVLVWAAVSLAAFALGADIEQYRVTRGHYPPSLLSVHKDYSPEVIGIDKFHYEPSGDAYNLIFEQPASPLGTQEFVVYNPRGEQTATSHALDLLQFPPERLERARGYYAVHDVPHTRWKYFWFD